MKHLNAPSVLAADFSNLKKDFDMVNGSNADWFHVDVMDGRFVPNISFGMDIVKTMKSMAQKPLDVHLMIVDPDKYLEAFRDAGADVITVHYEACTHLHRTISAIQDLGMKACVSVNPHTPVHLLQEVLPMLDMVLVMTVNPGFGGQAYIKEMETKVSALRGLISDGGYDVDIEVDGGISASTISGASAAGANVLVSGSALYNYDEGLEHGVRDLRRIATEAQSG